MFSKKAKKMFTVDLTVTTYCQIDGEDFVNFCGLLRKRELYPCNFKLIYIVDTYVCKGGLISEGTFNLVLVIENFFTASVPQLFSPIIPKVIK